jgi:hypothetical protein
MVTHPMLSLFIKGELCHDTRKAAMIEKKSLHTDYRTVCLQSLTIFKIRLIFFMIVLKKFGLT